MPCAAIRSGTQTQGKVDRSGILGLKRRRRCGTAADERVHERRPASVQARIGTADLEMAGVRFDNDAAPLRAQRLEPERIETPISAEFDHGGIVGYVFEHGGEQHFFLRFVMPSAEADQFLHPIAVVAARDDLQAVVHDLHARAVGLLDHAAGVLHFRQNIRVTAACGHQDAFIDAPCRGNKMFEIVRVQATDLADGAARCRREWLQIGMRLVR